MNPAKTIPQPTNPLLIHLVLELILDNLSVKGLKNARLVSRMWHYVSVPRWKRNAIVNVRTNEVIPEKKCLELAHIWREVEDLTLKPFQHMRLHCKAFRCWHLWEAVKAKLTTLETLELRGYTFEDSFNLSELMRRNPSLKTLKFSAIFLETNMQTEIALFHSHPNVTRLEITESSGSYPHWLKYLLIRLLPKLPNLTDLSLTKLSRGGDTWAVAEAIAILHDRGQMPKLRKLEMKDLTPAHSLEVLKFARAMNILRGSLEVLSVSLSVTHALYQLMSLRDGLKKLTVLLVTAEGNGCFTPVGELDTSYFLLEKRLVTANVLTSFSFAIRRSFPNLQKLELLNYKLASSSAQADATTQTTQEADQLQRDIVKTFIGSDNLDHLSANEIDQLGHAALLSAEREMGVGEEALPLPLFYNRRSEVARQLRLGRFMAPVEPREPQMAHPAPFMRCPNSPIYEVVMENSQINSIRQENLQVDRRIIEGERIVVEEVTLRNRAVARQHMFQLYIPLMRRPHFTAKWELCPAPTKEIDQLLYGNLSATGKKWTAETAL